MYLFISPIIMIIVAIILIMIIIVIYLGLKVPLLGSSLGPKYSLFRYMDP